MCDSHCLKSLRRGVWVPAFAGTTAWMYYPLAAPTLENRLRMRSNRVSQTSR
jgi:hypothetical protein